MLADPLL